MPEECPILHDYLVYIRTHRAYSCVKMKEIQKVVHKLLREQYSVADSGGGGAGGGVRKGTKTYKLTSGRAEWFN